MAEERHNRVSPRFWSDPKVLAWDDDTKLLAMYLMTCEHRTTEGLFRLPKLYMQADLGWSPERLAKPFARLLADGFIEWDENSSVLLIVKALKNQPPQNPNQAKAAAKALSLLPPNALESRFVELAEAHSERLVEALPEGFGEGLPEPLPPSNSNSNSNSNSANPPSTDVDDEGFEEFWSAYPKRNGKKVGKEPTRVEWRKLSKPQRERALVGAKNLAASDQMPKDPERFLRVGKGGHRPFEDWQEPSARDGPSIEDTWQGVESGRLDLGGVR